MTTLKKVLLYLLILIGILGILNTIILIPYSASISLGVVLPSIVGTIFILFAIVNLKKTKPIFKKKWLLNTLIVIVCIGIIFIMIVEVLIISEAINNESENIKSNFVIVLGCGIFQDGSLTLTLKKRLDAAIEYMNRFPYTICVVSGGKGPNEPFPEAQAMGEYLMSQGIDKDKILYEDKSTSTKENLLYSSKVISQNYPDIEQTVALVSSDFHIFRIKFLAKRFNMQGIGISCDTSWYLRLNCYMREFFGVIKSFVLDTV